VASLLPLLALGYLTSNYVAYGAVIVLGVGLVFWMLLRGYLVELPKDL